MKAWIIYCNGQGYINDFRRVNAKSIAALAEEWLCEQREKPDPEDVKVEKHLGWPWRYAVSVEGCYAAGFEKQSQAEHFARLISKQPEE
ncbi:MAG: hypothetical protein AB1330_10815 [Bacillota bacterium]